MTNDLKNKILADSLIKEKEDCFRINWKNDSVKAAIHYAESPEEARLIVLFLKERDFKTTDIFGKFYIPEIDCGERKTKWVESWEYFEDDYWGYRS